MILQLHWQFKDGTTEMRAQKDFGNDPPNEELLPWINEVKKDHPLPKGAIWMMVGQGSPLFIVQPKEEYQNG
jgi:hypothetical protein